MSKHEESADPVINESSVIVTMLDEPSWEEIESWLAEGADRNVNCDSEVDDDASESILQSDRKE